MEKGEFLTLDTMLCFLREKEMQAVYFQDLCRAALCDDPETDGLYSQQPPAWLGLNQDLPFMNIKVAYGKKHKENSTKPK